GSLEGFRGVRLEVLELVEDTQAGIGHLDALDCQIPRLLVIAPRSKLARRFSGSNPADDTVVAVDVPVEAAYLAVSDDVHVGALHVADGRIRGVVQPLLDVRNPQ